MVERLTFQVDGSKGDRYEVVFERDGLNITASCTCPAGGFGRACKHRLALLYGEVGALASGNQSDVSVLASWLPNSDVATALSALRQAEAVAEAAKRDLSRCKQALGRALAD